MTASIVILISGRGSNMEAIVNAVSAGKIAGKVTAVIANKPDAAGLNFAKKAGIDSICVDHNQYENRESFEAALIKRIDAYQPTVVALAGFMRILTPHFINHYEGRLLNIHPSLLPAFPGLNTHRRVLEAGVKWHGCTVHFITETLDCGPIIIQAAVPVLPDDDEHLLSQRVLTMEHQIYPQAISWFVNEQLSIEKDCVRIKDDKEAQFRSYQFEQQ